MDGCDGSQGRVMTSAAFRVKVAQSVRADRCECRIWYREFLRLSAAGAAARMLEDGGGSRKKDAHFPPAKGCSACLERLPGMANQAVAMSPGKQEGDV